MNIFDRLFRPTGVSNYDRRPRVEMGNPINDFGGSQFNFPAVTGVAGAPSIRDMQSAIEMNGGVMSTRVRPSRGSKPTWTYDMSTMGGNGFDIPRFFSREKGSEIF